MQKTAHTEVLINLLPEKISSGTSSVLHRSVQYLKFITTTLALVLCLGLFFQLLLVMTFSTTYAHIKDNLNTINVSQPLENGVHEIGSRIQFIKTLQAQPDNLHIVQAFTQIIPPELKLSELSIEGTQLILKGNTLDIGAIKNLSILLRNRKEFKNFTVTQVVVPSVNSAFYTITATVDLTPPPGNVQ